jgi:Protein of unknown function (DUF2934)
MTTAIEAVQANAASAENDDGDYFPILPQSHTQFEVRQKMISEAAYFLASRRDFEPGNELEDWLAAEVAIDQHLHNGPG